MYCVRYYKASGKISKHIEWMWVMFLDILFGYKDMKIINACIPLIKTNQYKGILCSTYRTFPLTAAKTLAIHTNLPFVVVYEILSSNTPPTNIYRINSIHFHG